MTNETPNPVQCPECDRTFETTQGMRMHAGRAHKLPADGTARERLAQATAVLFPEIPHDRIIEIADWQKQTLKLLS